MHEDVEFKYNPITIILFAIIAIAMLGGASYFVIDLILTSEYGVLAVAMILWSVCGLFVYYVFSFVNKLIRGTPAILLTDDYLIVAIPNLKISYDDIDDVVIRQGSRTTNLGINLTNPEKYLNTRIKRLASGGFGSDENLNLNLDLIWGKNETIAQSINNYRDKYVAAKL